MKAYILSAIRTCGPITTAELEAEVLHQEQFNPTAWKDVKPMPVRYVLRELEAEGLVAFDGERWEAVKQMAVEKELQGSLFDG